jgi:hypothetical protein
MPEYVYCMVTEALALFGLATIYGSKREEMRDGRSYGFLSSLPNNTGNPRASGLSEIQGHLAPWVLCGPCVPL